MNENSVNNEPKNQRASTSAREKARAMQAKQAKSDKRKSLFLRLGIVGGAILAVAALAFFAIFNNGSDIDYTSGVAPAAANEAGGIVLTSTDEIIEYNELDTISAEDIPNHNGIYQFDQRIEDDKPHVIIYTDPACPHCANFEEQHHQYLEEALNSQLITLEYRSVSFLNQSSRGYSSRAGNSFFCMAEESPENYFDFIGTVTAQGETLSASDLIDYASDEYNADIEDCVSSSRYRALTAYSTNLATSSGVSGTPTVLVDGLTWQEYGGTFPQMISDALDGTLESPFTENGAGSH